MFGWLKKDPIDRLRRQYETLMREARDIQRGGDIKAYAAKIAEAESLGKRIEDLERERGR